MAVSCLEQRLPPLTDAVPAYAPWGPFGLPPSMEAEEEEAEAAAEDLAASPMNTRRSSRRCRTWGGYIPHTMNEESPTGTMMAEDAQSFHPSFNTEIEDGSGTHQSQFVEDIDLKDIPELRGGLEAFEPGGSESAPPALHAGMAAFEASAPQGLHLDARWRVREAPDDMPAPGSGLVTFESDEADTPRREAPWRSHETNQDMAALRASIASLGQDVPEALHRELPWRGHGANQDMAALRAGLAALRQDGPEAFHREVARPGGEPSRGALALQAGLTALGRDGPQGFQAEAPWPRREACWDAPGMRAGFAALARDAPEGLPMGAPGQGQEARQDVQALRLGLAALGRPGAAAGLAQDGQSDLARGAPWRSLGPEQDAFALRAGLQALELQERGQPSGAAPWLGRGGPQGMPAFGAGLPAFEQDGQGRPWGEAPWCGGGGLQGGLRGGGQGMQAMMPHGEGGQSPQAMMPQSSQAMMPHGEDRGEGYFGTDSMNPGGSFGAAADPAYIGGPAPRQGAEYIAAPRRGQHAPVGPAGAHTSPAAQAPAAPVARPRRQQGFAGGQAPGWAAEQWGGKGGTPVGWTADDAQAQRQSNPASGWSVTDTKAAFVEPGVTTLMIQNLPPLISRRHFLEEIDRNGFDKLYNYCHLPMAFDTGNNKGFAFINFVEPQVAQAFHAAYNGSFVFASQNLDKALRVVKAEVQGFNANAAKALSKKTRRIRNSNFKPVLAGHPSDTSAIVGA